MVWYKRNGLKKHDFLHYCICTCSGCADTKKTGNYHYHWAAVVVPWCMGGSAATVVVTKLQLGYPYAGGKAGGHASHSAGLPVHWPLLRYLQLHPPTHPVGRAPPPYHLQPIRLPLGAGAGCCAPGPPGVLLLRCSAPDASGMSLGAVAAWHHWLCNCARFWLWLFFLIVCFQCLVQMCVVVCDQILTHWFQLKADGLRFCT